MNLTNRLKIRKLVTKQFNDDDLLRCIMMRVKNNEDAETIIKYMENCDSASSEELVLFSMDAKRARDKGMEPEGILYWRQKMS